MLQPECFREPVLAARIRERPEDFRVEEDLGFEPDGEGEHWLLRIEKRERDTLAVARELARFAGVAPLAVGFAGLKDRRAVAVQHFTVRAPHLAAGDWRRLERPGLRVLAAARHRRKLPRGAHRGNRFELGLRLLDGEPGAIAARIEAIARLGFPNHFGPQRFGRGGANLHEPAGIARVRGPERGMRLSAVRAALFNALLAARIEERKLGPAARGRPGDARRPRHPLPGRGSWGSGAGGAARGRRDPPERPALGPRRSGNRGRAAGARARGRGAPSRVGGGPASRAA
ncbi:MAG: tRNA pseudouridine(13) synthase TruD [Xanthomonadales bacterium]|nr:tRNA pseudouridine(13) synthase TruD [Xanthomonadales bacterium]